MSGLPFVPDSPAQAEAWSDECFASPLDDEPGLDADPGAPALTWSLVAMCLVLLAVVLPVIGSVPPLLAAGRAMRKLALLSPSERRRVPLYLRTRVRRRALASAGFSGLFAVLWVSYLF